MAQRAAGASLHRELWRVEVIVAQVVLVHLAGPHKGQEDPEKGAAHEEDQAPGPRQQDLAQEKVLREDLEAACGERRRVMMAHWLERMACPSGKPKRERASE